MLHWIFVSAALYAAGISGQKLAAETQLSSTCILNGESLQKFQFNKGNTGLSPNEFAVENKKQECIEKTDDVDICRQFNSKKYPLNLPPYPEVETPELATVLELILVDWIILPKDMISTQDGRALLKSYEEESRTALERALKAYNNNSQFFRYSLRTFWSKQAQKNFDANFECPYDQHRYVIDDEISPSCRCNKELLQSSYDPKLRDPPAPFADVNKTLSIHIAEGPGTGEPDIYSVYKKFGMSKSQLYLEKHIDQFYRILFFFQELRVRNIWTYQDDVPLDSIPTGVQKLLWHGATYSRYLRGLGKSIKKTMIDTKNFIRDLFCICFSQPWEEDMWRIINAEQSSENQVRIGRITTSTTTTTTESIATTVNATTSVISTTNPTVSKKGKKGKLYVYRCGKHFVEEPPNKFPKKCCQCEYENKGFEGSISDPASVKKYVDTCLKNQYNYTVTNSEDPVFVVCSMICQHHHEQLKQMMQNIGTFGYITYSKNLEYKLLPNQEFTSLLTRLHNF